MIQIRFKKMRFQQKRGWSEKRRSLMPSIYRNLVVIGQRILRPDRLKGLEILVLRPIRAASGNKWRCQNKPWRNVSLPALPVLAATDQRPRLPAAFAASMVSPLRDPWIQRTASLQFLWIQKTSSIEKMVQATKTLSNKRLTSTILINSWNKGTSPSFRSQNNIGQNSTKWITWNPPRN